MDRWLEVPWQQRQYVTRSAGSPEKLRTSRIEFRGMDEEIEKGERIAPGGLGEVPDRLAPCDYLEVVLAEKIDESRADTLGVQTLLRERRGCRHEPGITSALRKVVTRPRSSSVK